MIRKSKPVEKTTEKAFKIVGYVRVSSQGQAENGISLEAQRAKIKQYAELNDAELINIYADEGISGKKVSNRPGLLEALQVAKAEKAAFVFYSLSRFGRSLRDVLKMTDELQKAGAAIVSISEKIDTVSAIGKVVFRILAALNEFEIEQMSERTKGALSHLKTQGKKTGGLVPYGFTKNKDNQLTPNTQEQKVIRTINKCYQNGMNYSKIAAFLNNENITSKNGGKWFAQTVKQVIINPYKLQK